MGFCVPPSLPDLSWHNVPKREKYTKWPQNLPIGRKIVPMVIKHTNNTDILQDRQKFIQYWIFGLKIYNLATLCSIAEMRMRRTYKRQ
jgi:hypothetical protein